MKEFIKDMFSGSSEVSSKRVNGTLGFIVSMVFIGIWQHDLISMLLITSASLIGLQSVADIFNKKN